MVEQIAFLIRDFAVPTTTVVAVVIMLFIAYRRGLFERVKVPKEEPRTIVVHGNLVGDIGTPSSANLREIALDATKVDEYHRQSIAQSRVSFWFSLIFASLGFLLIASSVFAYSEKTGYLGVVAGTVIDAVAALFFYQSNRARKLMADFFDRLRADRKIEEALKLCDAIDDEVIQNGLRTKLALHFSGLDNSDETLKMILRSFLPSSVTNEKTNSDTQSGPPVDDQNHVGADDDVGNRYV